MRLRSLRAVLTALVVVAVTALPGVASAADEPAGTAVEVSTAVLRWGMSNEANNAAFAQGTHNFFSAGKIADPGRGNVALTQAGWKQRSGSVEVQKWNGSAYRPATWGGRGTDQDGVAITSPGSGRYSGHQFVFSAGAGSVDPEAGTAHIAWDGDVSVLFYSGFTFFYLSDPVLDVADGRGTVTATLSGFGSTRENPDAWVAIPPQTVTVADLPAVDLADEDGFNAAPAYDGVTTTLDGLARTGSFPQSFVSFMNDLGTAAFWRSSGSSTDVAKKALPLTVSFDAAAPVDPVDPEDPDPLPAIDNDAPEPPRTITRTVTRSTTVTVAAPAAPPAAPAAPAAPVLDPLTASPVVQLVAAAPAAPLREGSDAWAWWLGGGFLLLAALVLAGSFVPFPAGRAPAPGTTR